MWIRSLYEEDVDMSEYKTSWTALTDCAGVGDAGGQMDGKFILMGPNDKARLEKDLSDAIKDDNDSDYTVDSQYYLERLEATHYFITAMVPEDDGVMLEDGTAEERKNFLDTEATWWDFSATLAKMIDGVWYLWADDPSDVGNLWYQSTYTKIQAYAVRDAAIQFCEEDRLLAGVDEAGDFYRHIRKTVMDFW